MPTARRDVGGDPNLPSPASCLSEEAIDLICAFVRDDDDTATVTQTLRSLALTARRFLSSAVRALWFDPTRVIKSHGSWDDMQLCLEALLISPHLGNYIHSLRHLPAIYDIVGYEGLSDRDFHVWCWTVMRLAPRIQAVGIMPWSDSDCCKALAGDPHIRDLWLHFPPDCDGPNTVAAAHDLQTFLLQAGIQRLRSLGLPPLDPEITHAPPPWSPLVIDVEHIDFQDPFGGGLLSDLHDWVHFRGVRTATYRASEYFNSDVTIFQAMPSSLDQLTIEPEDDDFCVTADLADLPLLPNLTFLRLRGLDVKTQSLAALPDKLPALRTLRLHDCGWVEDIFDVDSEEIWFDFVQSAPRLRNLAFVACDAVLFDISDLGLLCDLRRIDLSWTPQTRLPAVLEPISNSLGSVPSRSSSPNSPLARRPCYDDTPEQTPEPKEAAALFYWVFDGLGRPFAVPHDPDDLCFCPTPSAYDYDYDYDYDYAYDYIFLDDSPEQYLDEPDYLPPPPDEPRLEPDFEAIEPDNEDDSCSSYEPWLDWSDPCDIGAADAAWAAYDINDRGKAKKGKRRRWREDIELQEVLFRSSCCIFSPTRTPPGAEMPADQELPKRLTPSSNLRSPASCLSEEAIDLVCAYVRDDDDIQLATDTLCSLAMTARRFLSSAVRALWYDPTRAIAASDSRWQMQRCLEKLLLAPHLGHYIRALRHLPALLDIILVAGLAALDFSVWLLTVLQLCPRIAAATTMPRRWISGCLKVASLPTVRDLRLELTPGQWADGVTYEASLCRDFLRTANPGKLRSLALPPLELDTEGDAEPLVVDVEHLVLSSCYLEFLDAPLLSKVFVFRGLRSITWQVDDHDTVQLAVLDGSTDELLELTIEPHRRLVEPPWHFSDLKLDVWLEELPILDRLVHLRLRSVFLRTTEVEALPTRCPALELFSVSDCSWVDTALEAWLRLVEKLPHLRELYFDACERSQIRGPLKEACSARGIGFQWSLALPSGELTDTDSSADDAVDSSRSASPWAEGELPTGETESAWYWVFNEIGRPFAIPRDPLRFSSCPAAYERDATCDDAMSDISRGEWQLDEIEYLPAMPDEPRFEPGYEAVDPDNEDESCSTYEPWLTWSDPCDLATADVAWIAYDIDEEGSEMSVRSLGDLEDGDQALQEAMRDFVSGRSEANSKP